MKYSEDPDLRRIQMEGEFERQTNPPKWFSLTCFFIGVFFTIKAVIELFGG